MTQRDDHIATLPDSAAERARVKVLFDDYSSRTGMTLADFAQRIGYSHSTLVMWHGDKYHHIAGTHRLLNRAIAQFIEQNPVAPPTEMFGELYETENAQIIRRTIRELLKRPSGYLVYGPPGSQKTFTLEYEIARLNREELGKNGAGQRAYYVYAMKGITPTQLMTEIAIACGARVTNDKCRLQRNLAWEFKQRRVLLAIDEAQNLGRNDAEWVACLETVRVLLDRPPYFSLLLAGMHTLMSKFNRMSAHLGQWNDRVAGKKMLPGLSEDEARAIALREIPDMPAKKVREAIEEATRTDAYNSNKPYINIRSLTGTLRNVQALRESKAVASGQ